MKNFLMKNLLRLLASSTSKVSVKTNPTLVRGTLLLNIHPEDIPQIETELLYEEKLAKAAEYIIWMENVQKGISLVENDGGKVDETLAENAGKSDETLAENASERDEIVAEVGNFMSTVENAGMKLMVSSLFDPFSCLVSSSILFVCFILTCFCCRAWAILRRWQLFSTISTHSTRISTHSTRMSTHSTRMSTHSMS
jgi:hypothetical protein